VRKVALFSYLAILSLILAAGCAPKKQIPAEEIRGRADRAFEDLEKEEAGGKSTPEGGGSSVRPIERPGKEPAVQVTKGTRPDWVDGESIQYPSSQYLTGVGYDPERKTAEDKARAEIAKIFISKINSRTKSYQDYLQVTSSGKSEQEETFSIQEITDVSTKKVLSGVRIAGVYQDQGPEKLYYALAVLDRDQSAAILSDRIGKLDHETQLLFETARNEDDLLMKIKHLKQSIGKYVMREAYNTELRIVSQSGRGISPPIQFPEIKRELEAILLNDFFVGVSVTGARADEVRAALVQGLNQEGFAVSEDLSAANVLIRGAVTINPLDRGEGEWKYVRWQTNFDMVDKEGGSVFGSVTKTGREGHLSIQQAENRAVRKMRDTLITEIAGEMRKYIFSQ